MFATLRSRLAPLYVLAAVLVIPLLGHAWQLHVVGQTGQAAAARIAHSKPAAVSGKPVRIVIPAATIDLPVVTGTQDIRTRIWSVDPRRANYADITAAPNNRQGQTLIYGHNNHRVFGHILGLRPGAVAYVYTENDHVFEYRYTNSQNLTPDRSDLFNQLKQGTGLVLMTCDGPQFEYRHVMFFRLVKAA